MHRHTRDRARRALARLEHGGKGRVIALLALCAFATRAVDTNQQVAIYIKNRVIVVFPNKEVDVGAMNPSDQLVIREVSGPNGRDSTAFIECRAVE